MWTPSLAYVGALERIVTSDTRPAFAVVNLVVVDLIVLSSIELPLLLYAVAPGHAARASRAAAEWLTRLGWPLPAALAGLGGLYLVAQGWRRIT